MYTEADLAARLTDAEAVRAPMIDSKAVLRRARRRRLPRQIAVGTAVSLAAVGIGVAGISGIGSGSGASSTAGDAASLPESGADPSDVDQSDVDQPKVGQPGEGSSGGVTDPGIDPGTAPSDGISRAPAEKLNGCGAELADVAPSATGLVLTTEFPDVAAADGGSVEGIVRMTNTGTTTVQGLTAAVPAITLSADGITLWHSNGAMIMSATVVDLQPGASLEYRAGFSAVRCSAEDDAAQQFRDGLPAVPPGGYQVSAAIDFAPSAGSGEAPILDLISGPLEQIELK